MKVSSHNRDVVLDGWRGFSILAVLIGHLIVLPGINAGRLGVEMFFVLSGRLMAEILFNKGTPLFIFYKRRISRVWPALFVFIFISWMFFHNATGIYKLSNIVALSCITLTYNYVRLIIGEGAAVIDHIWSLCVEEHIYLLLGLMALICRNFKIDPLKVLIVFILAMLVNGTFQTYVLGFDYYQVYWRSDVRGASILLGAFVYLYINKNQTNCAWWVPLVFAALGVLLNIYPVPDPIKYSLGTACLAISINSLRFSNEITKQVLTNKLVIGLGLISYSLYLWQQPFYKLKTQYPFFLIVLAIFTSAYLSYKFVETPTRKYLNKRWAK